VVRDQCGWTGGGSIAREEVCALDCHIEEDCPECVYRINFNGTASDLVFQPASEPSPQGTDEYFELKSGKIAWTVSGNPSGSCTASGGSTIDIPEGKGLLRVSPTDNGIEYAMYGYTEVEFQYTLTCGGNPQTVSRQVGIWLCTGGEQFSSQTDAVGGSYFFQGPGGSAPSCPVGTGGSVASQGLSGNTRSYGWSLTR
jgi:hypothetical protein